MEERRTVDDRRRARGGKDRVHEVPRRVLLGSALVGVRVALHPTPDTYTRPPTPNTPTVVCCWCVHTRGLPYTRLPYTRPRTLRSERHSRENATMKTSRRASMSTRSALFALASFPFCLWCPRRKEHLCRRGLPALSSIPFLHFIRLLAAHANVILIRVGLPFLLCLAFLACFLVFQKRETGTVPIANIGLPSGKGGRGGGGLEAA